MEEFKSLTPFAITMGYNQINDKGKTYSKQDSFGQVYNLKSLAIGPFSCKAFANMMLNC